MINTNIAGTAPDSYRYVITKLRLRGIKFESSKEN